MDEGKKRLLIELVDRMEQAIEHAKDAKVLSLRMRLSSQQLRAVDVAVSAMDECFTGGEL